MAAEFKRLASNSGNQTDALRCWRKADPFRFGWMVRTFGDVPDTVADRLSREENESRIRYLLRESPEFRAWFKSRAPACRSYEMNMDPNRPEDLSPECKDALYNPSLHGHYTTAMGRIIEDELAARASSMGEASGFYDYTESVLKEAMGEEELAQSTLKALDYAINYYHDQPQLARSLTKCKDLVHQRRRAIQTLLRDPLPDVLARVTQGY